MAHYAYAQANKLESLVQQTGIKPQVYAVMYRNFTPAPDIDYYQLGRLAPGYKALLTNTDQSWAHNWFWSSVNNISSQLGQNDS